MVQIKEKADLMVKVLAVIIHYRGKKYTVACLESLGRARKAGFALQTMVVDNNSPEPITDLPEKFPEVIFRKNENNLGFAGGNNTGIKFALKNDADFILFLNNDTLVEQNFLVEMLKVIKKTNVGIVAPKIYFTPGHEYHQERYKTQDQGKVFWYAGGLIDWNNVLTRHRGVDEVDRGQYDEEVPTGFASGCAMLVKREVFEKIGSFDDRYFLYLEDLEFCQRAQKAGYKIIYAPKARLFHNNAGSSAVGGPLHDYYITRNRLLFGMQYASLRTRINLLKEGLKIIFTGRSWQRIAVRDFILRKFGKGSWYDKNE